MGTRTDHRALSPGTTTTHRRDEQRQHGEERRGAAAGAAKKSVVARSILKSRSSSPSQEGALSPPSSSFARPRNDAFEKKVTADMGSNNGCTSDSIDGGAIGGGIEGIELNSKALNVSASGAFYERASSRRNRHKRALSENSASQAEAIPLGLGGGGAKTATDRNAKHRKTMRGSVLAPELPEALAAATAESRPKSALGVGARKRPSGDVDPHWNAVLLRKKAREEKERQQLAKQWRGSVITPRTSVGMSRTTSTESAARNRNTSGAKSNKQSTRPSAGKMNSLKEQQALYSKLAPSRGIAGAATGVGRTGTTAAVDSKEVPPVEPRARTAASERRLSAPAPSVAQGVLMSSCLGKGKPNVVAAAAGKPTATLSGKKAARPSAPAVPTAPSQPEIIVIDD